MAEAKKVVVINIGPTIIPWLETILPVGSYDVVFSELYEQPHADIKLMQPYLVILRMDMNNQAGFNFLTMHQIDPDTRGIPLLTYAAAVNGDGTEYETPRKTDTQLFGPQLVDFMN